MLNANNKSIAISKPLHNHFKTIVLNHHLRSFRCGKSLVLIASIFRVNPAFFLGIYIYVVFPIIF